MKSSPSQDHQPQVERRAGRVFQACRLALRNTRTVLDQPHRGAVAPAAPEDAAALGPRGGSCGGGGGSDVCARADRRGGRKHGHGWVERQWVRNAVDLQRDVEHYLATVTGPVPVAAGSRAALDAMSDCKHESTSAQYGHSVDITRRGITLTEPDEYLG